MDGRLTRIVCIDDDEDILAVAKLCLEQIGGYEVSCMPKSIHAVQTAKAVRPDLILVDVMMPQMDGLTVLRHIRQEEALRDVPVAFLTARVQSEEVAEYLKAGAAGVIAKPFDPMRLCDQINDIWDAA